MDHFIIIRFNIGLYHRKDIEEDDRSKWMEYRINIFRDITFKSLLKQKEKKFKIIILMDSLTKEKYINEIKKIVFNQNVFILFLDLDFIFYSNHNFGEKITSEIKKFLLNNFCKENDLVAMTRIDSDDYVLRTFTKYIQMNFKNINKEDYFISFNNFFIAIQKKDGFDILTNEFKNNQFITLIDKIDDNFRSVYHYSHCCMSDYFDMIKISDTSHCVFFLHGENVSIISNIKKYGKKKGHFIRKLSKLDYLFKVKD